MNADEIQAPVQHLKPARDNVWYWLATLHGEQPKDKFDETLAEKNRAAWLRWFAPPNNDKLYVDLKKNGFSGYELEPFNEDERWKLLADYARRTGCAMPRSLPLPHIPVDYTNTLFESRVSFRRFLFVGYVDFTGAKFSELTDFDEATFVKPAYFNTAEFSAGAKFRRTTFSARADFKEANFSKLVTFHEAKIFNDANFRNSTFSEEAYFQKVKFSEEANFREAQFFKRADFINAEFCGKTVFAGSKFVCSVPDFRGAKLHEATEWHGVSWPDPEVGVKYQDKVYAYERLRQEMERLKKPEDEQFFVRKEFRAKRGMVKAWSGEWLLNCGYELLSNYGHSIARPLYGLLVLLLLGSFIFRWMPDKPMTMLNALTFSFSSLFSVFPGASKIVSSGEFEALSNWLKLYAVVQFIFGALLLFLLGLALRNRFRMK